MSNKGKVFTRADLPRITQQRLSKDGQVSKEEQADIDAWLDRQTKRNEIVAMDGDTPIIAEELEERTMRHFATDTMTGEIDGTVLAALRGLMVLTEDQRDQVLGSFGDGTSKLDNPFDPPPKASKPKK